MKLLRCAHSCRARLTVGRGDPLSADPFDVLHPNPTLYRTYASLAWIEKKQR